MLLLEPQPSVVVVPDRHGAGTNARLLDRPMRSTLVRSGLARDRHLALAASAGLEGAVRVLPSLALDIDTPDDLATLRARFSSQRGAGLRPRVACWPRASMSGLRITRPSAACRRSRPAMISPD